MHAGMVCLVNAGSRAGDPWGVAIAIVHFQWTESTTVCRVSSSVYKTLYYLTVK